MTCTRCWVCRRTRTSTPTRSTAWCREKTCHLPKVGDRFTLGSYDGVVTRTAKRRVTEVRLTPAEKPEPEKDDDEKSHYGRMTSK